jgi:hypothetical protein
MNHDPGEEIERPKRIPKSKKIFVSGSIPCDPGKSTYICLIATNQITENGTIQQQIYLRPDIFANVLI